MILSQEHKSIVKKLFQLQGNLNHLIKDEKNPHFKSEFVPLPDLLEEVLPKAKALNLLLTQGNVVVDGKPYLESRFTDVESCEYAYILWPVEPAQPNPNALASCVTYGRRYGLKGLLAMIEKDDDGAAGSGITAAPATNSARSGGFGRGAASPTSNPMEQKDRAESKPAPAPAAASPEADKPKEEPKEAAPAARPSLRQGFRGN